MENKNQPTSIIITGVNIGCFQATGYPDNRSITIELTDEQIDKIKKFQDLGYSLSQSSLNYNI